MIAGYKRNEDMQSLPPRKSSEQLNSQSEDEVSNLFPMSELQDLTSALAILEENYDKQLHAFELTNYCFRCPLKQLAEAYSAFRAHHHPELALPPISNLYDNSAFVDLSAFAQKSSAQYYDVNALFIPPVPKNVGEMLGEIFARWGYVPNYERFLLFFPAYLEKQMLVEKQLFESDQIDSKVAYFLAVAAAAELGSVYVMARMLKRFLKDGGLMEWVTEGKFPQKYRLILPLNRYMARAPWEITSDMVEIILENNSCHWSKSELAICAQILAFTHSMATIALGVGLLPEDPSALCFLNLSKIQEIKNTFDVTVYESAVESKVKLADMIPVLQEIEYEQEQRLCEKNEFKEQLMVSKKILKKSMRRSEVVDSYMKEIGNELTKQEVYREIHGLVGPLLPPFHLIDKRGELKNNVVDYSEFNYKFHAYPILHNFTQAMADKLEGLIEYSETMTRGNFGNERINHTKEFRKAVRYYSDNLCGYTHHEYDFKNQVASLLPMSLKFYIRLLTLSPFHINRQVIRETNHEAGQVECFDLGHLAILIANNKMSLALTLAIQAFEL